MRRREAIAAIAGVGTAFIAGCTDSDADHDFGIDTPDIERPEVNLFSDETGKEPVLSQVAHSAPKFVGEVAVFVWYDVADHSKDYSIQTRIETDDDKSEESKQLEQVRDRYPGFSGLGVELPDGAGDAFAGPNISVSLFEDGNEVDVAKERIRL